MSCPVCNDVGILVQPWTDADPDFALCLCPAANWARSDENGGRKTGYFGWQLWCARYQVDPARVFKLEEIYTAQELAAVGLLPKPQQIGREAALMGASRKRVKL